MNEVIKENYVKKEVREHFKFCLKCDNKKICERKDIVCKALHEWVLHSILEEKMVSTPKVL